ncbi:MAG: hypothetical protein AAGC95_01515 [Pseudomonadota bacterium]
MLEPSEAFERAVFSRVAPQAIALGNSLLSRETGFSATIMNEERRFALSMPTAALDASELVLRCKIGDCDMMIAVSDDQLHDLLPKLAADIRIRELPDTLIMAVVETALRPVLAGFAAFLNLPFALERREGNTPTDWISLIIHEVISDNLTPIAMLYACPFSLGAVMRALTAAPSVNAWNEAENVPVKIEARFWRTALTAGDLADLSCGDVVLLPEDYPPDQVSLIASDMKALLGTGRRDGSTVTFEELKGNNDGRE